MISVEAAKQIILDHCPPPGENYFSIDQCLGKITAEDIFCPIDLPPFDQSSMDGFALRHEDLASGTPLTIKGEIAAGESNNSQIEKGVAVRIFTGARVPPGADTVVMQEKTKRDHHLIYIQDEALMKGSSVRSKGFEIKQGDLALQKGSKITPAAIGFLASMGIEKIKVLTPPITTMIITGNEIQALGSPLEEGKIYDSNSYMLAASISKSGVDILTIHHVSDDLQLLNWTIRDALISSDVILLTGGVSVGDYDLVVKACELNEVESLFHRIKQKPGKPMYFGKKDKTLVFGLPGNPASSLTCFYEYVELCIRKMSGHETELKIIQAPLKNGYKKPGGLSHFLKAWYDGFEVRHLDAQESYRLKSFAGANCLILVPETATEIKAGELVEVHLIPV